MKKRSRKNYLYYYLLIPHTVTLAVFLLGCAEKLPEITLGPTGRSLAPFSKTTRLQVIPFTALPRHKHFARYVGDYLTQQLADRQPPAAKGFSSFQKVTEPTGMTLSGKVSLVNRADTTQPALTVIRCEITFEITDPNTNSIVYSTSLSDNVSRATDEEIRRCLRLMADAYLGRLFPEPHSFTVTLARGRSEFDRRGRHAALQGDYLAALGYFKQAIDARPDDHAALYNTAVICETLGDFTQAAAYCHRALQLASEEKYQVAYDRMRRSLHEK